MTKPFESRRHTIEMDQQQAINLVLEVKKHPCLYKTNLANYNKKSDTFQVWEEVGQAVNMSGADAKERWKNLRAVFLRHLRAERTDGKKMKPYYLSEYIKFIVPYLDTTLTTKAGKYSTEQIIETETIYHTIDGSDRSSEIHFDLQDDDPFLIKVEECNVQPSNSKKRRLSQHETTKQLSVHRETVGSNDTVTSFLKSLTPELNEMNHDQFKTFKRKVLALIDDIMMT